MVRERAGAVAAADGFVRRVAPWQGIGWAICGGWGAVVEPCSNQRLIHRYRGQAPSHRGIHSTVGGGLPPIAVSGFILVPRPTQAEACPSQVVALADQRPPAMPINYPPHNRQAQAMPARGAGAAVVQAQEGREDALPGAFRYAGAIVFHIDAAAHLADLVADQYLALGMAHGVAHQVLQGTVQVARLGIDPGIVPMRRRQANTTGHVDLRTQWR